MTRPKPLVLIILDGWGFRVFIRSLFFPLLITAVAQSQMPAGFHWVDFKQEASTVSKIAQALKAENYTAIREIGVMGGFALVTAVKREPEQPTPEGDQWLVFSVSMETMEVKTLLKGYNLQIKDWMSFESAKKPDLSLAYMDCWECEPASLFTVIHYQPQRGWRARWPNDNDTSQPGFCSSSQMLEIPILTKMWTRFLPCSRRLRARPARAHGTAHEIWVRGR